MEYLNYLKLVGDVYTKLGSWVHNAYMNEDECIELCSRVSNLLNEVQELLFQGYYRDHLLEPVIPVLRRFVEGNYPYDDYDFELTNLKLFLSDLRELIRRLRPLSLHTHILANEDIEKSDLIIPAVSEDLPF
jgi:hypothetical protein